MKTKILKNALLAIGTFTLVTKGPTYVGHFVHGFKAGMRGDDLETALKDPRYSK